MEEKRLVRLPIDPKTQSLCDQCVGLCCRYFALEIDEPTSTSDFEDLRWYLLHEDTVIFVEDGEWYVQINNKCRALGPDNRCAVYDNRPSICRRYGTKDCDWHAAEYEYDHLFTEADQLEAFAKEHLAKKRQRKARTRGKKGSARAPSKRRAARRAPRQVKTAQPPAKRKSA